MGERLTVVLQIGNTDDKITQIEWANFVKELRRIASVYGTIHFFGVSPGDAVWQNSCIVIEAWDRHIERMREHLKSLAKEYRQDSIAMTVGETEFVNYEARTVDG